MRVIYCDYFFSKLISNTLVIHRYELRKFPMKCFRYFFSSWLRAHQHEILWNHAHLVGQNNHIATLSSGRSVKLTSHFRLEWRFKIRGVLRYFLIDLMPHRVVLEHTDKFRSRIRFCTSTLQCSLPRGLVVQLFSFLKVLIIAFRFVPFILSRHLHTTGRFFPIEIPHFKAWNKLS